MKLDKADVLFSTYIRKKAGWRCEYCKKLCRRDGVMVTPLDASHYHHRRKESTRFDVQNVHALCRSCHMRMGGYKKSEDGEYDLWMKAILGREYEQLNTRANSVIKKKRLDMIKEIKMLLKEIDANM